MTPYYSEQGIEIYHGDCREILPTFPKFGLCLTDPPYGCDVKYGDSYSDDRDTYWDWFLTCLEIMRETSNVTVFTHRNHAMKHITNWDWVGVWNKPGSFGSRIGNSPVLPHWEPIFMFGIHSMGVLTDYISDVITVNPEIGKANVRGIGREKWVNGSQHYHPTPKPLNLYLKLMMIFGQGANTIVDPFCGSGTTLRAAKDLGRKAIGIEIEESYCEIAAKKLSQEVFRFDSTPPESPQPLPVVQ